jgi:thiosulfate/3-mercaptopyruvate sulfurtransferase
MKKKFSFFLAFFTLLICSLPIHSTESWFVSAETAKKKILTGKILLLDARNASDYKKSHIQFAHSLQWEDLSQTEISDKGKLLPTNEVKYKLEQIGITSNKEILVYGDPENGWGEEGRIVWTLRSLGHNKSYIVDGGYSHLISLHLPSTKDIPKFSTKGNFSPTTKPLYTVTIDEVRNDWKLKLSKIIDSREKREYLGAIPYGEKRSGHIPGAIQLHYKDLLSQNGEILKGEKLELLLKSKGITRQSKIISYCTGGIRSAWLTAVLRSNGFQAFNYPGSMWEWSNRDESEFPLVLRDSIE